MKKIISGIQQIGIGVENIEEAWAWYRKYFGMDVCIFEEKAVAEFMLHYTRGKACERHAVLAMNMQGGGGFEVWQHTGIKPNPPSQPLKLGDLGINVCKLKTINAKKAREYFLKEKLQVLSDILTTPNGVKHFFLADPYQNIFQIVEDDFIFVRDKRVNGGTFGAIIGVSDIQNSLKIYQDILHYDQIVYDETGQFADLSSLEGGNHIFRRVLLAHSQRREGAFAKMLGPTQIELVQVLDRAPDKVYEGRMWGDPGYIHICFDINGFDALKQECLEKGFPFTVDSTKARYIKPSIWVMLPVISHTFQIPTGHPLSLWKPVKYL
jgi:catechol 2,3-dioxygenase-like lactoylglutathione lyase family enzyme